MARPKKIIEDAQTDVEENTPFERTLYTKNGKTKPAKWPEIAAILEADGWEKVEK